ncbi:MAG TPA: hypothetical protein VHH36_05675 [Candidatus Thermoplasmatota archaeon]|nr:hypothetical protein [Candidatus Thermoplasmatota archaeon]
MESAEPLARLRGRLSDAEIEARLAALRAEFDGLLDDEALTLLVLDEMGLNDGAWVTIEDLPGRAEASVRVTVDRVEPPREFAREGRAPGRVGSCVVSDATGEARLTLWDRDVEKLEDGTLAPGRRVAVVNARVKQGRFGVELHVGPWTALQVEGALDPAARKLLQDVAGDAPASPSAPPPPAEPRTLVGTFLGVTPTRSYRKPDGSAGFVCDLDVETEAGRARVVAWDEAVRAARALKPMSRVAVENVVPKARGAATEWHTTRATTMRQA